MTPTLFIAGPTAVGKSAVALAMARRVDGEIIAVDSMQVYRGLDIGTAKPSALERAAVAHHLIDCVEPDAPFDAAAFVQLAQIAEAAIRTRGRVPIYCGGTGFYFSALLSGLGTAPGADLALRAQIAAEETPALLEELRLGDPETYERMDRQNRRRIARAVEVLRLTRQPFSSQRAEWKMEPRKNFFVLVREPEDLRARIHTRVDAMFAAGLVAETRALLPQLQHNRTAAQAIGYRQVMQHLAGELDLPATLAVIKLRTWQLARRQMTWFRKHQPTPWLSLSPSEAPEAAAQRIVDLLE